MIDWSSPETAALVNPRMPSRAKEGLMQTLQCLDSLKGHILLATSGSSGQFKWVALSKAGILESAKAVNEHLQSDRSDIWLNPLPSFHVGGLGIEARGYLSGAKVFFCQSSKWDPREFFIQLGSCQATLTALVPAQVFDLLSFNFRAPSCLRAVIVGGGALSEKLYFAAVEAGWKLLPSYGLTECASQVATAQLGSWDFRGYPLLYPLSHVEISLNSAGYLKIRSPALLTGYVSSYEVKDPKVEGWLTTEDKAVLDGGKIKAVSRDSSFVKIGGESVDLSRLERILEEERLALQLPCDIALVALPEERLGHAIHLISNASSCELQDLVERFAQRVMPFEKIRQVHCVREIPRSPLKKVLKDQLLKTITN